MTVQQLLDEINAALRDGNITAQSLVEIEIDELDGDAGAAAEIYSPNGAVVWVDEVTREGIFLISADANPPVADSIA